MNRGIYATANGMIAGQQMLDSIAQNLANASTTGYKRDGISFQDALIRTLRADGGTGPVLGELGSGAKEVGRYTDFAPGPIQRTGNPLDVAIKTREGAFAVQTPDGVRYTRDGSFTRSADGQLVTQSGFSVLDSQGRPIALPDGEALAIGPNGAITAGDQEIATLGVFEGSFTKIGNTLFAGSDSKPVASPSLEPEAIEGSNVDTLHSMIQMIEINRTFELSQRSIIQQDELTQKLIQSLSNPG
ncbi:MAG TPA: flagellar hook-basal body protein [Fimbriimonadaceae bacterium]|nr:flagellar hook-basal body protein [Fimbriimonadaceae bacterium]